MEIVKFQFFFILILQCLHTSVQFLLSETHRDISRCPSTVSHGQYLHSFQERCYEFVTYADKYWADARHDCQHKGGDLAVIDNGDLQTFVTSVLIALGNSKNGIWIGLTDSKHELHWEWVNGEPLQGYSNWAKNEGGRNALHFTQDCAQIRMDDHGRWHDKECHIWPQKFSYICQFEMLPVTTTSTSTTTTTSTTTPATTTSSTSSKPTTMPSTTTTTTISTTKTTTASVATETKSTTQMVNSTIVETTTVSRPATETELVANHQAETELVVTYPMDTDALPRQPTTLSRLLSTLNADINRINTTVARRLDSTPLVATETIQDATRIGIIDVLSTLSSLQQQRTSTTDGQTERFVDNRVTTTEATVVCSEVNCSKSCPHGYTGIYVDLNGCINCRCNT